MGRPKKTQTGRIYQLKVTLKDIRPPIWRRIQVSGDVKLDRLHEILQVVMGWGSYHLYDFTIGDTHYGEPDREYEDHGLTMKDAGRTKLSNLVHAEKDKFLYLYDFGDSWEHEVEVEKILNPEPGVQYPVCLAGRRACPPEHCGGVAGYKGLLRIIQDPFHEEHDEVMRWLGGAFDPEALEIDAINRELYEVFIGRPPEKKHKIGRNDPCPCGSGKKYKNCCGRLTQETEELPKAPDRRLMERHLRAVSQLIAEKDLQSIDEINAYLQQFNAKGSIPKWRPETPLEQAQELVYQALEQENTKERIRLAMQALEISQDCADAYVLLAEEAGELPEEARHWYQRGVEAGERALGREMFTEAAGKFWGIMETRPYMRAREGLADCLYVLGEEEAAIDHYKGMLELNPNDNQGIRYKLLSALMNKNDIDAAEDLLDKYDEPTTEWLFTRALISFIREGDSPVSEEQLRKAMTANPHVAPYLLGRRLLPETLPDRMEVGGDSEAVAYVAEFGEIWLDTSGALKWMHAMSRGKL